MKSIERQPNLAVVGMHGLPERTGLVLAENCAATPIEGWDVEVADYQAVVLGVRSVGDMWRKFPGSKLSKDYALRRPAEIVALAEPCDLVIEVHDRPDETGEYVVTCEIWNTRVLEVAAMLGIYRVIHHFDVNRLGSENENTLVVEMCRAEGKDSAKRIDDNVRRLRRCMGAIGSGHQEPFDAEDFEYYALHTELTWADAFAAGIDLEERLDPFQTLPRHIAQILNLPPNKEYVVEYWNGICSGSQDYFGGILRRTAPPLLTGNGSLLPPFIATSGFEAWSNQSTMMGE